MESVTRFFKGPEGSYFLFGPRGTGKSTLVRRAYADALTVDLLEPDTHRRLQAAPERLKELVEGNPAAHTIVIDEVQKAPDLLGVVHLLIEKRRDLSFILTGSSARKLKGAGVNLLGGRAQLRTMHPFMAAELGDRFRLDRALAEGLLPVVVAAKDPAGVVKSYAALYMREEVQAEGLVRNIGSFARFLEAVSFSHAQLLNVSNVARECAVERKVVEGYVQILEDLLLSYRVPVFTRRASRALVAHPKFFIFDAGVFRSLRPAGPLDGPHEIDGQALEGLVAQHLKAWLAYRGGDGALYYWRTRAGVEVDFVVYGKDGFWAIEVKNTARVRPEDLRGLKAFLDDYPACHALLLYRGRERLRRDGVLCLPCEEFLRALHPARPLDSGM